MKKPNFEETKGKHPIPHAKGIAKDDNLQPKSIKTHDGAKSEEE